MSVVAQKSINEETVRLFNSIFVDVKNVSQIKEDMLVRCVKNGYFLDEKIKATHDVLDAIEKNIGISGEKANKTLHKSWKTVSDTPIDVLVAQQIFHYITTYGFQSLGIYSEDSIYIPAEKLDVPDVEASKGFSLVYIKAITSEEELFNKVLELAASGVALSEQSIADLYNIIVAMEWQPAFVSEIKNRELKSKLYEHFEMAPSEPEEFVRYAVQKLTGESLVIKNDNIINAIKNNNDNLINTADVISQLIKVAPNNLASVFHRFKPIFLAMKSAAKKSDRHFFNRLRKDAVKMHKPMKEDYLNTITSRIKNRESLDGLEKALASANTFRKIRLLNALRMREEGTNKAVYAVRNGSGWVEDQFWPKGVRRRLKDTKKIVFNSIIEDVKNKLEGKTVYVSEKISYAAPATEKQFTGNIPFGSSVSATEDLVVGIYWENNGSPVDLDLSFTDMNDSKTGWDGFYRDDKMLFSGDIVDAPNGASESFYIKGNDVNGIFMANHYNRGWQTNLYDINKKDIVNAKIFVAEDSLKNNHSRYTMNPNKLILSSDIEIDSKQSTMAIAKDNTIYFVGRNIGAGISAKGGLVGAARDFYVRSLEKMLTMEEILEAAGAKISHDSEEICDIDLSFGNVDKTTFINILT